MKNLYVDVQNILRPIKPMHGVNNGPVTCNFRYDATPYFKDAGIPFSRLHDVEYPFGCGEYHDVSCIFKNFDRDPEDPTAYNFALTDLYFEYIQKAGAKIIYRLGCTIEHQASKRYIYPPKDFKKWAQICEHINRHYNEGWANGYHMNIEYWEIWNEPDGILWLGTPEQYYELYKTTALHLKSCFPNLKIGGPALCVGSNEFAEGMLDYLTAGDERVPLDFYSWHTYCSTPEQIVEQSENAHKLLVSHGYDKSESILDEWNYVTVNTWDEVGDAWDVIQSVKGAAFNASIMIALQNSTCDIATYYDAQLTFHHWWNGMFGRCKSRSFFTGMESVYPKKGYYPFKAFGELYRLGNQVSATSEDAQIYILAATNGSNKHAVMLANYSDDAACAKQMRLNLSGCDNAKSDIYLVDETHDFALVDTFEGTCKDITLPANSVMFVVVDA